MPTTRVERFTPEIATIIAQCSGVMVFYPIPIIGR